MVLILAQQYRVAQREHAPPVEFTNPLMQNRKAACFCYGLLCGFVLDVGQKRINFLCPNRGFSFPKVQLYLLE